MESDRDKRRLNRQHLFLYLKVLDPSSRALRGYVADLSLEGLLILSESPIALDTEFCLEIDVQADALAMNNPVFNARSIWSKKDANPKYTLTGFQFSDMDPATSAGLRRLIDTYGFSL